MKPISLKNAALVTGLSSVLLLTGCLEDNDSDNDSDSSPEPITYSYEVTTVNLTTGQPLSPLAVIAHAQSYSAFTIGEPASSGLELMAEGGDNSQLIEEAITNGAFATVSGTGPVAPSGEDTLTFELTEQEAQTAVVSVTSMLVNTNDAFTLVSGSLSELAPGETMALNGLTYDSGTEANSEASNTIPGPADSGVGFDAARDDIADQVTMHGGVITVDDGLESSVLNETHRWDNPVVRVFVTRTE